MDSGIWDFAGFIAALTTTGVVAYLVVALGGAVAKRIERGGRDQELVDEVDRLRAQVEDLAPLAERVPELEERVQFAERLLLAGPSTDRQDERTPV
jgi:hypothetical protein